jgi:ElaB/YqjD/DUF883 family membrane-anchored ribosome-binding protein
MKRRKGTILSPPSFEMEERETHRNDPRKEKFVMINKPDTLSDINRGTDYAADRSKSEIDELRQQVKDLTERYGSKAADTYYEAKETAKQKMGEVEGMIRDKPVQSTLAAAGIGFLIGALLSR